MCFRFSSKCTESFLRKLYILLLPQHFVHQKHLKPPPPVMQGGTTPCLKLKSDINVKFINFWGFFPYSFFIARFLQEKLERVIGI